MFDSGIPEALTRDQLLQLIKQKENLEKEIKALHDVLKSQNVGKLIQYRQLSPSKMKQAVQLINIL